MLACASGKHIKNAVLTARRVGKTQAEFLTIALEEVLVSSHQTAGGGEEGSAPLESTSLNFSRIRVEYRETKPDGTSGYPGRLRVGRREERGPLESLVRKRRTNKPSSLASAADVPRSRGKHMVVTVAAVVAMAVLDDL